MQFICIYCIFIDVVVVAFFITIEVVFMFNFIIHSCNPIWGYTLLNFSPLGILSFLICATIKLMIFVVIGKGVHFDLQINLFVDTWQNSCVVFEFGVGLRFKQSKALGFKSLQWLSHGVLVHDLLYCVYHVFWIPRFVFVISFLDCNILINKVRLGSSSVCLHVLLLNWLGLVLVK